MMPENGFAEQLARAIYFELSMSKGSPSNNKELAIRRMVVPIEKALALNRRYADVLGELVRLKYIKEAMEANCATAAEHRDYNENKEKAWDAAKAIVLEAKRIVEAGK